jgi:hypothetical protein
MPQTKLDILDVYTPYLTYLNLRLMANSLKLFFIKLSF